MCVSTTLIRSFSVQALLVGTSVTSGHEHHVTKGCFVKTRVAHVALIIVLRKCWFTMKYIDIFTKHGYRNTSQCSKKPPQKKFC